MPMNDISSTIFYDNRIVISSPIKTPITWEVSKVDNTNPKGINTFTFSQSRWNEHTDAFHYVHEDDKDDFSPIFDPSRKILGIYANYFSSSITPTEITNDTTTPEVYGEISYSAQPQLKVGGSYKKFTIKMFDNNGEIDPIPSGTWKLYKDDVECNDIVNCIIDGNLMKVKFIGDDSYIGSVIRIKYITTTDNIETYVDVAVVGL